MFPNPQAALPLPSRPSLEHYKKRAKDLVKACRSGDPDAIGAWAREWLGSQADEVAGFARTKLSAETGDCVLADAQFVIARSYGFASWPRFAAHIEALERAQSSPISLFETAVDALMSGDEKTLARLLREQPDLARARSTREHHATLLIYTSANGVEGYRQKSPKNAPAIAEMLLAAGAEVDATAAVYGSECTTLGLVATSQPPSVAGVQIPIIDILLRHGARVQDPGLAGRDSSLVYACLANGQGRAAEYLAGKGAPIDLVCAAGIGRVDAVAMYFDERGQLVGATPDQLAMAWSLAAAYGQADAVAFLLDHGVDVNAIVSGHGDGHTALHVAAYHGHAALVRMLLARGARVDIIDKTWKTPPLSWVLTGWARKDAAPEPCYDVVAQLVRAGAHVKPEFFEWDKAREDPKMLAALQGKLQA